MQEQNRKPGNQKGQTQIVHRPVSKCWAHRYLRIELFAACDHKASAAAAGRREKLTSFFPGHVLTAHFSVKLN